MSRSGRRFGVVCAVKHLYLRAGRRTLEETRKTAKPECRISALPNAVRERRRKMGDNRNGNEDNAKRENGGSGSWKEKAPKHAERTTGEIRSREELKREFRSLPGEILRDFFATVRFWAVMIFFWALITSAGAWAGYLIGGNNDGLWLGAAIVGGASPIAMGFMLSLDVPGKVWRRLRGRRNKP
ncbi:hypothetical protein [Saccharibacillus alkalitolerans]|uniref:DUF4282 domain-containing protein n=1 Tax=Saccharibacillus alkalitolerans TaxID=2705290 RepID=A0ABX0F081_9BACL|nr:hypothetical protein [Saccharibacillus alkalitolerans]NGZ73828.1 hypothetical protein [Saccharibacillus alkalitolerans]